MNRMPRARAPENSTKLENFLSLSNVAPSSSVVYPPVSYYVLGPFGPPEDGGEGPPLGAY